VAVDLVKLFWGTFNNTVLRCVILSVLKIIVQGALMGFNLQKSLNKVSSEQFYKIEFLPFLWLSFLKVDQNL
jgi:hypothetical protein